MHMIAWYCLGQWILEKYWKWKKNSRFHQKVWEKDNQTISIAPLYCPKAGLPMETIHGGDDKEELFEGFSKVI